VLVLAGGFGTRLRSLVPDVPKPLAPVAGVPFLNYLIENWVDQGANELAFLLHHKADQIQKLIDDVSLRPEFESVRFECVVEDKPLGTGGSILNAIQELKICDSFLVVNADTWLELGLAEISVLEPNVVGCTMVPNCERYGALEIERNRIVRFAEKSSSRGSGLVNCGLYHLDPSAFFGFEVGSTFSLEEEIFPKLSQSSELKAEEIQGEFIDIGVPKDYLKFCEWHASRGEV